MRTDPAVMLPALPGAMHRAYARRICGPHCIEHVHVRTNERTNAHSAYVSRQLSFQTAREKRREPLPHHRSPNGPALRAKPQSKENPR